MRHLPARAHYPAAFLLMAIVAVGCRSSGPVTPTTQPAPPSPTVAARGDSIQWVRESAEYYAAALQTYRAATARVEQSAAGRAPGTWAVVLDADETAINNSQYQLERAHAGASFTPESWKAWVQRREATPTPGVARFLARVRELGGQIAIVTNRLESECADTAAVFDAHALAYDVILCRPDGGPSDKGPRFRAVAEGTTRLGGPPREVLVFLGDNIHDFPDMSQQARQQGDPAFTSFGVRYFLLPNPMYGSWQVAR